MPDKTIKVKYGSRRKVYNGSALMTAGGLRKEHLMKTKRGRIVSIKKHEQMLKKHGGNLNAPEEEL